MKSRAQLAEEPRTMQFVIESECRFAHKSLSEEKRARLPVVVWVQIPAEPRVHYSCTASDFVWRAVEYSEFEKHFGPLEEDGRYPCVCEHMGYLLE